MPIFLSWFILFIFSTLYILPIQIRTANNSGIQRFVLLATIWLWFHSLIAKISQFPVVFTKFISNSTEKPKPNYANQEWELSENSQSTNSFLLSWPHFLKLEQRNGTANRPQNAIKYKKLFFYGRNLCLTLSRIVS